MTYRELSEWADAFSEFMDEAEMDGRERDTALVLLTALLVGTDEARVARVSGVDSAWVMSRATALRQNGIWQDGLMRYEWLHDLLDGKHAEAKVGLVLDSLVADREVVKRKNGYKLAEATNHKVVWDAIYEQDTAEIQVPKSSHASVRNAVTQVGRELGRDLGTSTVGIDGSYVTLEIYERQAA